MISPIKWFTETFTESEGEIRTLLDFYEKHYSYTIDDYHCALKQYIPFFDKKPSLMSHLNLLAGMANFGIKADAAGYCLRMAFEMSYKKALNTGSFGLTADEVIIDDYSNIKQLLDPNKNSAE